jgi:Site-specific recombinase XerD
MAYVRKRVLPSGKVRWQTVWNDASGKRASEMYDTSREANAKRVEVEGKRPSSTVAFRIMAATYLEHIEMLVGQGELERSYLDMLRNHVNNHILSDVELAGTKCSSLGTPEIQLYLNRLISRIGAKSAAKIRTTLSQLCKHGSRTGFLATNPTRDAEVKRNRRPEAGKEAPFTLPSKKDLKALLDGAAAFDDTGRAAAAVRVLMFGGLRMSELRGLERRDCRLKGERPKLSIVQRADRYNKIGPVKSKAGRRDVDLGSDTAQALRVWLLKAPNPQPQKLSRRAAQAARKAGNAEAQMGDALAPAPINAPVMAFPGTGGGIWSKSAFRAWFWVPLMNRCGLVTDQPADAHIRAAAKSNADFKMPAFGVHMLRHVYASLQIEQGVSPKRLQKLIGHATLKMTLDTYGHLWPDEDADRQRARGVERMI